MQVELAKISLDTSTQSRAAINEDVVSDYVEIIQKGLFPPVILFNDGKTYYIADGWHRVLAAHKTGAETINADVQQGTLRDAIYYSIGSNIDHGLPRTDEDKRKAVEMILADKEWSNTSLRKIADKVGVGTMTVKRVRDKMTVPVVQSDIRVGADGRTTNTANIGKKKKPNPPPEPEFEPPKPKKKQRGKSLFKDIQRIVSQGHQTITGKKLDWDKDAARITYHLDKITDLAIDSARHFVLLILQDHLAELGVQVDKGKIPGKFVPGELEKYWLNLERYLSAQNMQRVVDGATADLKKKRKQGDMFE